MADYKKRAIDLLNWIDTDEGNRALAEFPQAGPTVVASAQVYATLALAEQQRIANLIALGAIGGGPINNAMSGYVTDYLRSDFPEIAKGLGL